MLLRSRTGTFGTESGIRDPEDLAKKDVAQGAN